MTETKFTKPEFTKPKVPEFSTKGGNIDITKTMKPEEINAMTAAVAIKHFKYFYDDLVKSIEDYSNTIETNIVTPLSSTIDAIGIKTAGMDTRIGEIEDRVDSFEIAG